MKLVDFISSNPIILAIANFTALIAACVLVFQGAKRAIAFLNVVYQTNIVTAIRRQRINAYSMGWWCARDITLYTAFITTRLTMVFMSLFALSLTLARPIASRQQFLDSPPRFNFDSYASYVSFHKRISDVFFVVGFILIGYIGYNIFRVLAVSHNVLRFRFKMHRREMSRRQNVDGEDPLM